MKRIIKKNILITVMMLSLSIMPVDANASWLSSVRKYGLNSELIEQDKQFQEQYENETPIGSPIAIMTAFGIMYLSSNRKRKNC